MLSTVTSASAIALSAKINSEDGVETAIKSFYNHMHVENMICDVSIFMGESQLAHVWCPDCGFKMTREVCDVIHKDMIPRHQRILPCSYMNWEVLREPTSAASAVIQGIGGATHELAGGITSALVEPVSAVYRDGLRGAVGGIVTGVVQGLIVKPIVGGFVMYNKFSEGLRHTLQSPPEGRRHGLPDPNTHFTRHGSMERQEASMYGRGPLSYGVDDCMQESTASVVSLTPPGRKPLVPISDDSTAGPVETGTGPLLTDTSDSVVSPDVLALDHLMHTEIGSGIFDSTTSLMMGQSPIQIRYPQAPQSPSSRPGDSKSSSSRSPDGQLVMTARGSSTSADSEDDTGSGGDGPRIHYSAVLAGEQSLSWGEGDEEEDVDGEGVVRMARRIGGVGGSPSLSLVDSGDEGMQLSTALEDINSSMPVFAGLVEVGILTKCPLMHLFSSQ